MIPRIVISTGEPAGIGPDLAIMLANNSYDVDIVVLGCPTLLAERATQLNTTVTIQPFVKGGVRKLHQAGTLTVLPITLTNKVNAGVLNKHNAQYVIDMLDCAIAGCQDQEFDAMVTAPVQKSILNDAGFIFSGHTEYLAEKTHTPRVVMMLATKELRVALATTHLPLRDVADAITATLLTDIITILDHDLRYYFGIQSPRILVSGLNPHAGEGGHLGHEEIDTIIPTLDHLRKQGLSLIGPLPADTLFTAKYLNNADAVLAMYHDQGLPVLKYQGFGRAANITLGLPIIRTSVDHGTALDLAGTGNIDSGSLETALMIAIDMVNKRTQHGT